ncbi:MAG: hypothetical protein ACNA7K_04750 [Acholeplasmataceae bacterium]
MKKELAYKSVSQIIWTAITIGLAFLMAFSFANYYAFDFSIMPEQIILIVGAFTFIGIFSLVFFVILILNPKCILSYTEEGLYHHQRQQKEVFIPFNEIDKVHTTISIWAKPFLVYTSLVITLQDKTITVRYIKDMPDVRDQIKHLVFEK